MICSANYVYNYSTDGQIVRLDPATGTVSTVYSDAGYQFKRLNVSSDDRITCSAIELQSGDRVILEISSGGTAQVVDRIDGHWVVQFERID